MNQDHPTPEVYPLPDAVVEVIEGRLPIPRGEGFHAVTNLRDGCLFCAMYLQHPHDAVAAWPF